MITASRIVSGILIIVSTTQARIPIIAESRSFPEINPPKISLLLRTVSTITFARTGLNMA